MIRSAAGDCGVLTFTYLTQSLSIMTIDFSLQKYYNS